MIEQSDMIEKYNHILLKFDLDLSTKADRMTITQFKEEADKKYMFKDAKLEFDNKYSKLKERN